MTAFEGDFLPPGLAVLRRPYPMAGPGRVELHAEGLRLVGPRLRRGGGFLGCLAFVLVFFGGILLLGALAGGAWVQERASDVVALIVFLPALFTAWLVQRLWIQRHLRGASPAGTHDIPWALVGGVQSGGGRESEVLIVPIRGRGDLYFRPADRSGFLHAMRRS